MAKDKKVTKKTTIQVDLKFDRLGARGTRAWFIINDRLQALSKALQPLELPIRTFTNEEKQASLEVDEKAFSKSKKLDQLKEILRKQGWSLGIKEFRIRRIKTVTTTTEESEVI